MRYLIFALSFISFFTTALAAPASKDSANSQTRTTAALMILSSKTPDDFAANLSGKRSAEDAKFIKTTFDRLGSDAHKPVIKSIRAHQIYIQGIAEPFEYSNGQIKHRGFIYKLRENESFESSVQRFAAMKISEEKAKVSNGRAPASEGFVPKNVPAPERRPSQGPFAKNDFYASGFYAALLASEMSYLTDDDLRELAQLGTKQIKNIRCTNKAGTEVSDDSHSTYEYTFSDGSILKVVRPSRELLVSWSQQEDLSLVDPAVKVQAASEAYLYKFCRMPKFDRDDTIQEIAQRQKQVQPAAPKGTVN